MAEQYTIQQVANITEVSAHTLRYYERIGLLTIRRASNGHRRYTDSDIGWIRFIMLLRETDMPLTEIATFMQLEQDGQTTVDKRLHMLEDHRHDLIQHIHKLNGFLNKLDAKIDYYSHVTTELCDCVTAEVKATSEGA